MKSIVKIEWSQDKDGKWIAKLLTASKDSFSREKLVPGKKFNCEISTEKRCTGFIPERGERVKCPEFRKVKKGSQCPECRAKDIYSGYVRGDTQTELEGEFSVYLAQISDNVKVGVTRSGNIPKRWIEQGADYAVEILPELEARVALENESDISSKGITERIRKELKLPAANNSKLLERTMDEHGYEGDIVDVQSLTAYPEPNGALARKGLFKGSLEAVKGQIISNGRVGMVFGSGRILKKPQQKGLADY